MDHTTAKVRLCSPRDTGSAYTWIKASRLRELGIEPMTR
ncbi:hypothetical protein Vsou_01740 [Vulcanisaeta souniana JCM 11219]|uniref:Uncharacterized protein n=1 Tax=Vulcanisaeta souniana JCM 11219 TaxID=1293586 RepID=A0ABM8BJE1_9CREN|nr:hypothetical protein Vsou_01740 [Vulcanisaeta souniana JCM 11219]